MSPDPGWFPDPANPYITRFWTGRGWGEERVWNGASWESRTAPPPPIGVPVTPFSPAPAFGVPAQAGAVQARAPRSPAQLLLFAGAAVAVAGACLPWEKTQIELGISTSKGPINGGGIAIIVVFIAATVWIASVPYSTMSSRRRTGLWALAVGGALLVAVVLKGIDNDKKALDIGSQLLGGGSHVTVGSGLFVFAAGIGLIWFGIIGAAMSSSKAAGPR